MAQWLSWLERRPVTAEVESSSLFWVACFIKYDAATNNFILWGLSSAGRASALQAEGHRFEPYRPHRNQGWIPEWPKGADCKSVGTAFEGSNPSPPIRCFTTLELMTKAHVSRCGSIGRAADL